MSNAPTSPNVSSASLSPAQHMGAGNFFGAIHGAREQCGAIFTEVRHSSPRKLPRHSHEQLPRILDKLHAEHCRRLMLDELAREAGVHPVHFSRVFRRCVGEGMGEHVHRLRVRTACERMLAQYVSLSELSFGTGFADQSHFTRAFRKINGTTPAAFRSLVTTQGDSQSASSPSSD